MMENRTELEEIGYYMCVEDYLMHKYEGGQVAFKKGQIYKFNGRMEAKSELFDLHEMADEQDFDSYFQIVDHSESSPSQEAQEDKTISICSAHQPRRKDCPACHVQPFTTATTQDQSEWQQETQNRIAGLGAMETVEGTNIREKFWYAIDAAFTGCSDDNFRSRIDFAAGNCERVFNEQSQSNSALEQEVREAKDLLLEILECWTEDHQAEYYQSKIKAFLNTP